MTSPSDVVGEVWRAESARIVAGLARLLAGDVGMAEEVAHDAVAAALEQWPREGVPANPAAWLTSVARRRAVDALRRIERRHRGHAVVAHETGTRQDDEIPDTDHVDDDVLRLMFVSCHPLLATEARVALTLRLLGGLRTDEIARAFLVNETTVAQRIARAKQALAAAQVRFEVPAEAERAARLDSVLDVVYLVFNEGYTATDGDDWMRPALCAEALRLGRLLAGFVPGLAQVHGLVALMELQASRSYDQTLTRLRRALGEDLPVADLTAAGVAAVFAAAWTDAAPATWNRHRGALRSFAARVGASDLDALLDRRPEPRNRTRPLPPGAVAALTGAAGVRERALWWLVHESGVSAGRALALDVDALDLPHRRTLDGTVAWGERTAELLPELVAGRRSGPLFLAERRAARVADSPRTPEPADVCPETGRRRLSYERAEYLFKRASGGHTLRQLRATRAGAASAR